MAIAHSARPQYNGPPASNCHPIACCAYIHVHIYVYIEREIYTCIYYARGEARLQATHEPLACIYIGARRHRNRRLLNEARARVRCCIDRGRPDARAPRSLPPLPRATFSRSRYVYITWCACEREKVGAAAADAFVRPRKICRRGKFRRGKRRGLERRIEAFFGGEEALEFR